MTSCLLFKPKHEINVLSGGGNRATNKSLIKAQTLEEVVETEGKLTGAVNKREKRVRWRKVHAGKNQASFLWNRAGGRREEAADSGQNKWAKIMFWSTVVPNSKPEAIIHQDGEKWWDLAERGREGRTAKDKRGKVKWSLGMDEEPKPFQARAACSTDWNEDGSAQWAVP